jgi:hypothetical protein
MLNTLVNLDAYIFDDAQKQGIYPVLTLSSTSISTAPPHVEGYVYIYTHSVLIDQILINEDQIVINYSFTGVFRVNK